MIWSADLVVAFALIWSPEPPATVVDRVRAAVAREWDVPADRVRLEWGHWSTRDQVADSAPFRLLGGGNGGRFVVAVRTVKGAETAVAVRGGVHQSVWVAARALPAGRTVERGDLTMVERVIWGAPSLPNGVTPIGWETRRSLAAGDLVAGLAVEAPPLVRQGDKIAFVWERDGFRVVREGVATRRARLGERVIGRSADAGRDGEQLVGIVVGPGLARLESKGSQ